MNCRFMKFVVPIRRKTGQGSIEFSTAKTSDNLTSVLKIAASYHCELNIYLNSPFF